MSAYFKTTSTVKAATLAGKDSALVSSVQYLKFDRTDLTDDIRVTSTNDYQFTLDYTAGASFILIGSTSIAQSSSTDAEIIFQWYDETNAAYIGKKGSLMSSPGSSSKDQEDKNPAYRTAAIALIDSGAFSGANITVSLRVVSTSGTVNYSFEPTGFENHSGFPCLQIYQSR